MRIKSFILLLTTGLWAVFTPVSANAQAMGGASALPQFMPASGWSVEPTALAQARGLSNIKLPCMMATQYDNGYIMRFSGGGGNVMAMAIDFRQNVFHQGRRYQAVLSLNTGYKQQLKATAFSASVLIFNLRKANGFHQALQGALDMVLDIDGNAMKFSLGGVKEALNRVEACYNPKAATQMAMSQAGGAPAAIIPASVPAHGSGKALSGQWSDEVKPLSKSVSRAVRAPRPANVKTWNAKAGDDVRTTLEGWATRAGVDVAWQAGQGGKVVRDIHLSGTFEEAVQMLMAENAAAMGLDANMTGSTKTRGAVSSRASAGVSSVSRASSGSAPQSLVSRRFSGNVSSPSSSPSSSYGRGQFFAPAGSSLQQTLQIWSKKAGVDFEWQSNMAFTIKEDVRGQSSYEAALQALLNQYAGDKVRPAAQLNNDPETGERILFIHATRVL